MAGDFQFETYGSLPRSRAKQPRQSAAGRAAIHGLTEAEVGTIDSQVFLAFLWRVAGRPVDAPADWQRERMAVFVIDNYTVHKSAAVQAALPALAAAQIYVFYLPAYSPELSAMEPIWRAVKYHDLVERSHTMLGHLKHTVDHTLTQKVAALRRPPAETASLLPLPT